MTIVAPGDTVSGSPKDIPEIVMVDPAGAGEAVAAGPPVIATGELLEP
jgi:hypothetical protein